MRRRMASFSVGLDPRICTVPADGSSTGDGGCAAGWSCPAPLRPNKPGDGRAFDLEGHVVERQMAAVAAGQTGHGDRRCHGFESPLPLFLLLLSGVVNEVEQRLGIEPEPVGLSDHRLDVAGRELLAAVVEQLGPRRREPRTSRCPAVSRKSALDPGMLIPLAAVAGLIRW